MSTCNCGADQLTVDHYQFKSIPLLNNEMFVDGDKYKKVKIRAKKYKHKSWCIHYNLLNQENTGDLI